MTVPDHPVAAVLRQRRSIGSRPGRRDDGLRIALAVEGGGMRGVVSAGMLIALADLGLANAFDEVFGSSAGSINATYFLQGQRWEALALYYADLSGREFIDRRRVLHRLPLVDLTFLRDVILAERLPISLNRVRASGIRLVVGITNIDEKRVQLVDDFASSADLVESLAAGSWLPILAGPPPVFRSHRCLDAGVLLDHPSTAAIASGCSHVLVLSTRHPQSQNRPEGWQRILRRYLSSLEPSLGDVYWRHAVATVGSRAKLARRTEETAVRPAVLAIAPRMAWKPLGRLTQDLALLLGGAREGYEAAVQALTGAPPTTVYSVATVGVPPVGRETPADTGGARHERSVQPNPSSP